MADGESVEILVALRNLQQFLAGTKEASAGIGAIGKAAEKSTALTIRSAGKVPGVVGLIGRASRATGGVVASAGRGIVATFARIGAAAGRTARTVREKFALMGKGMLGLGAGKGMLGGLGGLALGGLLTFGSMAGIKSAVDFTEMLGVQSAATAKIMGMSTQTMAEWFALASAHGVNVRTLAMSFRAMATQINGANNGSKQATELFKSMGISEQDLAKTGGNMNDTMFMILDHLNKMPGGAAKTYAATRLLGRGWQTLMPLLGQGSKHLKEQMALARKLGIDMGKDPVKAAEQLHDAQVKLRLVMEAFQIFVATKLVPVFVWLVDHAVTLWGAIRQRLTPAFEWLKEVVRKASDFLSHHKEVLRELKGVIPVVIGALVGLRVAFKLLNIIVGKNPYVILIVAIIALVTWLVHLYNHNAKARKIMDDVWKVAKNAAKAAYPVVKAVIQGLIAAGKWLIGAFNYVKTHWRGVWNEIVRVARWAWNNVLHPTFNVIKFVIVNIVIPAVKILAAVFRVAWQVIRSAVRIAWAIIKPILTVMIGIFKTIIIPTVKLIGGAFKLAWKVVSDAVSIAWPIIKPIIGFIKDRLNDLKGVVKLFGDIFHKAFSIIGDAVSWVWNNVLKGFFEFLKGIIDRIDSLLNKLGTLAGRVQSLGDIFGGGAGMGVQTATPSAPSPGTVPTPVGNIGGGHGALAMGGSVVRGGIIRVGERGPELLHAPSGTVVTPLKRSEKTEVNRGSLREMNLVTIVQIDRKEIARAVGRYIDDEMARGR